MRKIISHIFLILFLTSPLYAATYYAEPKGSIDHDTINDGNLLALDFDDTDTPGWVKVTVRGYYLGDVN